MQFKNNISTSISPQDVKEILTQIKKIDSALKNLVTLTEEEKKAMPNVGKDTASFVTFVLDIAEKDPDLIPKTVNIDEMKKDAELIRAINKIYAPMKEMVQKLEDSALLASSEAYLPALSIFNSYKNTLRKNMIDSRANFNNYPKAGPKKGKLDIQVA